MKKMVKSKEGISPILATLLLIVIAVAAVIVTSWTSNTRYYFKFLTQAGNTWEHNEVSD